MLDIVAHPTPQALVLRLRGELDTQASQELDARLEALVAGLDRPLVLELEGLNYLNSTGLRTFLRLDKLLKAGGRGFAISGVSPRIGRIFRYCGLDTFFTFEAAPGALRQQGA